MSQTRPSPRGGAMKEGSLSLEENHLVDARQAKASLERAIEMFDEMAQTPRLPEHRNKRRELHAEGVAQVALAARFLEEIEVRAEEKGERVK